MCPNGNRFFTSIPLNLIHNMNENESILQIIGIKTDEPITLMVQKLRELLVQEFGPNKAEYCVWDADNYESEANNFLQDGYNTF